MVDNSFDKQARLERRRMQIERSESAKSNDVLKAFEVVVEARVR